MRIPITLLIICLLFCPSIRAQTAGITDAEIECKTDLAPRDKASKYIEALKCLNQVVSALKREIEILRPDLNTTDRKADDAAADAAYARAASERAEERAAAAESAALRAAASYEDVKMKLDRNYKGSMRQ